MPPKAKSKAAAKAKASGAKAKTTARNSNKSSRANSLIIDESDSKSVDELPLSLDHKYRRDGRAEHFFRLECEDFLDFIDEHYNQDDIDTPLDSVKLIDTRESQDYELSHIANAISLPRVGKGTWSWPQVPKELKDKSKHLIFYSHGGYTGDGVEIANYVGEQLISKDAKQFLKNSGALGSVIEMPKNARTRGQKEILEMMDKNSGQMMRRMLGNGNINSNGNNISNGNSARNVKKTNNTKNDFDRDSDSDYNSDPNDKEYNSDESENSSDEYLSPRRGKVKRRLNGRGGTTMGAEYTNKNGKYTRRKKALPPIKKINPIHTDKGYMNRMSPAAKRRRLEVETFDGENNKKMFSNLLVSASASSSETELATMSTNFSTVISPKNKLLMHQLKPILPKVYVLIGGFTKIVELILNGRRNISPDKIEKLSKYLKIKTGFENVWRSIHKASMEGSPFRKRTRMDLDLMRKLAFYQNERIKNPNKQLDLDSDLLKDAGLEFFATEGLGPRKASNSSVGFNKVLF